MALQGVCEIELRDEQGNIVQKTKDKNMITNGISAYLDADYNMMLRLLREDDIIDNYNRLTPVIEKLIGGVYLFNEVQDEIESNIIPNPFAIVASGSLSKSTISDDRAGIWNVDESSIIYNEQGKVIGFKFVWDFLTARGNGTIKSVSLTTDMGARSMLNNYYIGHYYINNSSISYYGLIAPFNLINPIDEKKSRNTKDYDFKIKNAHSSINFNGSIIGSINNEIISLTGFDYSLKKVTFSKYRLKNEITIGEKIFSDTILNSFELVGIYVIDLSDMGIYFSSNSNIKNGLSYSSHFYNGYIYIGYAYDKKISIKIIDAKNMTPTETLIKTFEAGNLNKSYYDFYSYLVSTIAPIGNYYAVMKRDEQSNKIIFLNRTDFTIAKEIDICPVYTDNQFLGVNHPITYGYLNKNLFMEVLYRKKTDNSNSTDSYITIIVDEDLEIIKNDGKIFMESYPIQSDIFKYPYLLSKVGSRNYNNTSIYFSSLYNDLLVSANTKFTIDNLATPVTKTASQTMKVIYTIKDAEQQPAQ